MPSEVVGALLCTYFPGDYGVQTLQTSRALVGSPNGLVTHLNELPDKVIEPGVGYACTAMGRLSYRIVLTYVDHASMIVEIDTNCLTAAQDGAVKDLGSLEKLLSFWQ